MRAGRSLVTSAIAVLAILCVAQADRAAAAGGTFKAGAGRADITPPTGYFMMGWVRSDSKAEGQLTRLYARTLVLERGDRKLALVAVDLAFVPAGLVADIVERLEDRGFGEESVIISASHTHSAPAGYSNYGAFNTVAPTSTTPTEFEVGTPADPQLYTFLAERIAKSVRRADADRAPAAAGWGETKLYGVTENRSVEGHLAEHDIFEEFGQGSAELDPLGVRHTVDAQVNVLRVDKIDRGRRVPIGIWSTFPNHGTVVKPSFVYYNGDHHASAARLAEAAIRREGNVPPGQEVVNAYGNSDEGDMTAGLSESGPAGAHKVGRAESKAFLRAWRQAGTSLTSTPALDSRWTIECFCGNPTAEGPVDDRAVVGLPFLTGSEENRGPLYDETGVPFEGYRLPAGVGPQGVKIQSVQDTGGTFPTSVPLTTARIDDRAIVTVPGEMTSGMGRILRSHAEQAVAGTGIKRVVISGLANDFIQYLSSPAEYDRQHYEGGSTLFGRTTSVFIEERLIALLELMVAGEAAPPPDEDNRRNGVDDNAGAFPPGADSAEALEQPKTTRRLRHARFRWQGGPDGTDRPLDRAFVKIQRRQGGRWRAADSDLGLRVLWKVDEDGVYEALWEAPRNARLGRYRFKVTGNLYRLRSKPFRLRASRKLKVKVIDQSPGRTVLGLSYPRALEDEDFTWRPARAKIGGVRLNARSIALNGKTAVITSSPGASLRIRRGAVRDTSGNRNGNALRVEPSQ